MIDERFVILGSALAFVGGVSYVISTIKGKTRPNRVSWFMWALIPMVAFSAEIDQGVGLVALMTFIVGLNPLLIFLASFVNRKAVWKLTRFDVVCGVLSGIGVVVWLTTGVGNAAILFSIVADALAGVPTLVKAYKKPETENWHLFFLGAVNAAIALLAIDIWDFAHYAFPAYILILTLTLLAFIKLRIGVRRKLSASTIVADEDVRPMP